MHAANSPDAGTRTGPISELAFMYTPTKIQLVTHNSLASSCSLGRIRVVGGGGECGLCFSTRSSLVFVPSHPLILAQSLGDKVGDLYLRCRPARRSTFRLSSSSGYFFKHISQRRV